ncbi:MAG: hypothetical protein M9913_06985 [Bryobacteraceae bacterium]|nr:hypothetical protein [Solibacteraceae bacterium]MCO5350627.1 hypothetical protein [Bryobacteraceae bacterium]
MRPLALFLLALPLAAQVVDQRGYLESRSFFFPQSAPGDSARYVGEALLRYESSFRLRPNLRLHAWADARFDSHRQFEREPRLDLFDRRLQRPAASLRRLSLLFNHRGWTLEAGRQFIRWGKADILNPTDRFAPRDFLNVFNPEFLGITAVRATYERGSNTFDLVYAPGFTPSRSPLLNQRWVVLPEDVRSLPIDDLGFRFPQRAQAGARFNRLGAGYEFSLSFYDGFNHLPLINANPRFFPQPAIQLQRFFPQMRMYGADAAVPLRWFTLKSEAGFFTSTSPEADHYLQYVFQAEKISGEWVFTGGYAGEHITKRRSPLDFAPDRGITKTFLGRASYNLNPLSSLAFEGAIRQNGLGFYSKWEYSRMAGRNWRWTAGYVLIRGRQDDFLGQFRRNSHAYFTLRYSF